MYKVILASSAVFLTASGVNRTSKNVGKQVLIFTNCDDPAGDCEVRDRRDFHRTTIQRAKVSSNLVYSRTLQKPLDCKKPFIPSTIV